MLTKAHWEAECRLMAEVFPEFTPFADANVCGFKGTIRGNRTECLYTVTIQAKVMDYPYFPPSVYVTPHPEPCLIDLNGQLSVSYSWRPSKNSFATMVLITTQCVAEFDGTGEKSTPSIL